MDGLSAFSIDGGALLALSRGVWVAALLSVFGALLFRVVVAAPVTSDATLERRWRRLFWSSWIVAAAAMSVWLVLEAASIADAGTLREALSAVTDVAAATQFGHLLLLQAGLLALAALVVRRAASAALPFASVATALQAWHGHAAAMADGPSVLLLSGIVHLLAAGAWLGGLTPLLLLVATVPPPAAAQACRRFSPLGMGCVLLLAATAAVQSWVLIGGLPGLVGTGYGLTALLKAALFAVLIGFAAYHRFRLTPALATGAEPRLVWSLAAETGFGLLVVIAAGFLTSMPPAMHVQPIWPFPLQLSLDAVREDDDFRREVIGAACALAVAVVLLAAAVFVRRVRWPAVALAAIIGWFAVPHLDLLLAEAHPTSFFVSPTHFAAVSIANGAGIYAAQCAACHGADGSGDGPAAAGLAIPPADLTAAHLWMHSDGELFWWLSHGIDAPEGGLAMPGFAAVLSDGQRWALIDYVRAHNAGLAARGTGEWSPPVQAPGFEAQCGDAGLRGLHGSVVRLVFGSPRPTAMRPGVVIVFANADASPSACVATDPALRPAYAIVAGLAEAELPGIEFLIDGEGWLRAIDPSSRSEDAVTAEIQALREHPIMAAQNKGMDMPM